MRKLFNVLVAALGMTAAGLAIALEPAPAPEFDVSQLQLDPNYAATQHTGTRTYIVQFKQEPGLSYRGGVPGYAATAPENGARYDARAGHVQMYTQSLVSAHDSALSEMGATDRKIYSYSHALNGFAAKLTASEAAKFRGDKNVLAVWEDYATSLDTNNSPEFLGLDDRREGLHRRQRLKGEDVIIGVMDTGAVQEHPSFSDTRTFDMPRFCDNPRGFWKKICRRLEHYRNQVVYDAPPAQWAGICQAGEAWSEDDCNNKMIGARWYVDGFLAGNGAVVEGEFLSPRDSSGHGSHTASTAGGNEVTASLSGTKLARIKGMAPRARIAVYKVCWLAPGATNFSCFFSDSAAATDAAIEDGVDVLNFSVGTAAAFNDTQDLAFLRAVDAGIFVARSGGNDGPGFGSINAGEPWVTSVAASTHSGTAFALAATVNSPAAVAGDYAALEGAITQSLRDSGPINDDLVAADPIDACTPLANGADMDGQIALIARGTCAFTDKVENAVNAGAIAVLMYSDDRPKTVMGGTPTPITLSVPGVMIDNEFGVAILDQIIAGEIVNVSLSAGNFTSEEIEGNIMADFSSRGPYLTEDNWIKPDITAPGVRVLAAYAPDQSDGSAGDLFAYLQGTSMSGPHIAGLGALVVQAHPDWSPAQVKSALMTTARQDVVKEDGVTPADPFDFGAGHVVPNDSINPGLTYDAAVLDYLAASCGTDTPLVSGDSCVFIEDTLGYSTDPSDLNLPSIGIGELVGTKTVTRTVTAVSDFKRSGWGYGHYGNGSSNRPSTYHVSVEAPEGFAVEVTPSSMRLRPGETATYEVTVSNQSAPPGQWFFGSLTWDDNKGHSVRSPIAVNATALIAPEEIVSAGSQGSESFDITFGFQGDYIAAGHGIIDSDIFYTPVEDDPNNSFQFFGPGTVDVFLAEIPEGTAIARWDLYNEYTSGDDDLDLYLYYCPNLLCSLIDQSGNFDSNESVSVTLPASDPSIDDPYLMFIHGYQTQDGLPTNVIYFQSILNVADDLGNLTVTAPSTAVLGETATVTADWAGLSTGSGFKQIGAISHSDAVGIQDLTILKFDNDPGGSICDYGLCPVPPP